MPRKQTEKTEKTVTGKKRKQDVESPELAENDNPRKGKMLRTAITASNLDSEPMEVLEQRSSAIQGRKMSALEKSNVKHQAKSSVTASVATAANVSKPVDRVSSAKFIAAPNASATAIGSLPLPRPQSSDAASTLHFNGAISDRSLKRSIWIYATVLAAIAFFISFGFRHSRSVNVSQPAPLQIGTSAPAPVHQTIVAKGVEKKTVKSVFKKPNNATTTPPPSISGNSAAASHSLFKSPTVNSTVVQRSIDSSSKTPTVFSPKVAQVSPEGHAPTFASVSSTTTTAAAVVQQRGKDVGLNDDKTRWIVGTRVAFGESSLFSTHISNHDSLIAKDVGGVWTGSRMVSSRHGRTRNTELTTAPLNTMKNPLAAFGHSLGILDLLSGDGSVSVVNRKFHVTRPPSLGDSYNMQGSSGSLSIQLYASIDVNKIIVFHRPDDFSCAPKRFTLLGWSHDPVINRKRAKPRLLGSYESLPAKSTTSPWELQSFEISSNRRNPKSGFRALTLQIHANHGHENKTCVYRMHVLGDVISSVSLGK